MSAVAMEQINKLASERSELFQQAANGGNSVATRMRIRQVTEELDALLPDVSQADHDEQTLLRDRSDHLAQTPDALRAAGRHQDRSRPELLVRGWG